MAELPKVRRCESREPSEFASWYESRYKLYSLGRPRGSIKLAAHSTSPLIKTTLTPFLLVNPRKRQTLNPISPNPEPFLLNPV